MNGQAPVGVTHAWYASDGEFKGWLKVASWVHFYDQKINQWVVIAKELGTLRGMVSPV